MSRDYDAEIALARREVESNTAQMEQVCSELMAVATQYLANWFGEQLKNYATKYHSHTEKLAAEGRLSEFKAAVESLKENAAGIGVLPQVKI